MLRARTFCARRKSLRVSCAYTYKRARNFFRPEYVDQKNSEYEQFLRSGQYVIIIHLSYTYCLRRSHRLYFPIASQWDFFLIV